MTYNRPYSEIIFVNVYIIRMIETNNSHYCTTTLQYSSTTLQHHLDYYPRKKELI